MQQTLFTIFCFKGKPMAKSILRKLRLILWKNLMSMKRHYIRTTMDITLPLLAILFLIFLILGGDNKSNMKEQVLPNVTTREQMYKTARKHIFNETTDTANLKIIEIGYSPNEDEVKKVVQDLLKKLCSSCTSYKTTPFATEEELESAVEKDTRNSSTDEPPLNFALIIPGGLKSRQNRADEDRTILYKIRLADVFFKIDKPAEQSDCRQTSFLSSEIFAGLQVIIDELLIGTLLQAPPSYELRIQKFPCPARSSYIKEYVLFIAFAFMMGFSSIVQTTILNIVLEKQSGIKELMKMIGLSNWMHWFGWMISSLVTSIITITLMTILLYISFGARGTVLKNSDFTVWWFFLFISAISTIAFCFMVASFFEKPNLAAEVGGIAWIICFYTIYAVDENAPLSSKLFWCLIPNVGFYFGIQILCQYEEDLGAQWKFIGKSLKLNESLNLGLVLLMMIVASSVYILLAMYLESILPTKYGITKPVYFPFMPSTYGFGRTEAKDVAALRAEAETTGSEGDSFERSSANLPVGLEVIKLTKTFGEKVAVKDVSIKAYEGQIFCLLGHNGAGKTTIMSVLTGMYAPTNGTAIINQKDLRTEMDEIRQDMGLCTQHNFFFDELTVAQHFKFFGMVKGLTSLEVESEIPNIIRKLQLEDKTDKLPSSLSGGQKRRLSLGCAIIGSPKVLFLDECGSGLDPEARKVLWNLLLEIREGKTIILTTHFMEEADVLADRIAIMAEGKIQCCGSPMFLKNHYGNECTLTVSVMNEGNTEVVLQNVRKYFPSAVLKSQTRNENAIELVIKIPSQEATTIQLSAMFSNVMPQKKSLQILDIAIAFTTMDNVFLRVEELISQSSTSGHTSNSNSVTFPSYNAERVLGIQLILSQFWGQVVKNILCYRRKWKILLGQYLLVILLSILIVVFVSDVTEYKLSPDHPSELKYSLLAYKDPAVLYTTSSDAGDAKEMGDEYARLVGSSAKKHDGDLSSFLLKMSQDKEHRDDYLQRHVIAAEFCTSSTPFSVKALYSSSYENSLPLSINLASNAMLRYKQNKHRIAAINHPLQRSRYVEDPFLSNSITEASTLFGSLIVWGLSFLSASYILEPVEERKCKAKHLQLMTGINPLLYWGSAFVCDYFAILLCGAMMVVCIFTFDDYERLTNNNATGVFFLIVAVYGIGAVVFSYLMSLIVQLPSRGFGLISIVHSLSSFLCSTIVFSMESNPNFRDLVVAVAWIGRLFPGYGIAKSLMVYAKLVTENSRCNGFTNEMKKIACSPYNTRNPDLKNNCCEFIPEPQSLLTWQYKFHPPRGPPSELAGIGQELLFMIIVACIYLAMLMLAEFGYFKRFWSTVFKRQAVDFVMTSNDDNVQAEVDRVENMVQRDLVSEDCFVVSQLCKFFGSLTAVSKLTFGVHHGQCFGILGVNGAGKTTTFRMLTGDEIISSGNAWIGNCSLQANKREFTKNIGYCPQFDGMIGILSGREMLKIFGTLRGIKNSQVTSVVNDWLNRFGLLESGNVQCKNYSGGMKRRLSVAMALIGDPLVLFLDEPTSGVDPASRKQFWNIISSLKGSGGCILLTSHSMDECETLCSRLGIMVNGEFQCLGRVQHLKNKFAQGYNLTIKLKPTTIEKTRDWSSLPSQVSTQQTTNLESVISETSLQPSTNKIMDLTSDTSFNTQSTNDLTAFLASESEYEVAVAPKLPPILTPLVNEVITKLHPCTLKDFHLNTIQFAIHSPDMPLDKVFETMEKIKTKFKSFIEEYYIQQTSLEDVFLSFAKKQHNCEDKKPSKCPRFC